MDVGLQSENIQSVEEQEEIQEQVRRQQELDNLLSDGIQPFSYDDNSINATNDDDDDNITDNNLKYSTNEASNLSIPTDILQNYREVMPNEQLKVLYDVRVREIQSLNEEFNAYRVEKCEEINILKKKCTLFEADQNQLQISLSNAQDLLAEKTTTIKALKDGLTDKNKEIEELKMSQQQDHLDINAFKSTIKELQMKQIENIPFISHEYESDQINAEFKDQIVKLELALEQEIKSRQYLDYKNEDLESNMVDVIKSRKELEDETNSTIIVLTQKLQTAQQQCKDLFILGEALKAESDHFKERLTQISNDSIPSSLTDAYQETQDVATCQMHLEKVKRMLVDKDIELQTLKCKLKLYDEDMKDFFEYKHLSLDCDLQPCGNKEHSGQFAFLKKTLNACEALANDRQQEIITLTAFNQQLQNKFIEVEEHEKSPNLTLTNQLKDDLAIAHIKVNQLQDELNVAKQDTNKKLLLSETTLKQLSNDKLDLEIKIKQLEHKNINNMKQCQDCVNNLEICEKLKEKYEMKVENLQIVNERLEAEKITFKNEIKVYHQEMDDIKAKVENANAINQKVVMDYKHEVLQLNNEIEGKNNAIKLLEGEKCALQEVVNKHMKEISELKEKIQSQSFVLSGPPENIQDMNLYNTCLQAELARKELEIRDELQKETTEKLKRIEGKYLSLHNERAKGVSKSKAQDVYYKKQLGEMLTFCSSKISALEKENAAVNLKSMNLFKEYEQFKTDANVIVEKYKMVVMQLTNELKRRQTQWKIAMDSCRKSLLDEDKHRLNNIVKFTTNVKKYQEQYDAVENEYGKKITFIKAKIRK